MSSTKSWSRDEDARNGIATDGSLKVPTEATVVPKRGKYTTHGLHHIAMVCRDMDETVQFYERVLGMKLRALFPMHGVEGAKHCFLEMGNGCEISFVQFKDEASAAGTGSTPGEMHHIAFRCNSEEHLKNLRSQVKACNVPVSKIIDHGFCHSCYFFDPNDFTLELTYTVYQYSSPDLDLSLLKRTPNSDEVHAPEPPNSKL